LLSPVDRFAEMIVDSETALLSPVLRLADAITELETALLSAVDAAADAAESSPLSLNATIQVLVVTYRWTDPIRLLLPAVSVNVPSALA